MIKFRQGGYIMILKVLEKGPLTGKELWTELGTDVFSLWKKCHLSNEVMCKRISKRYLRLDKNVKGYARLSPAIEREFLTYTVVGLKKDYKKVLERADALRREIEEISREKFMLAKQIAKEVLGKYKENACLILGGDVPIDMAHRDSRPERSRGEMVSGSDLDMIVVVEDELPENEMKAIDDALYQKKHACLATPVKEEVDYLVKRFSKVKEQASFDTLDKMIACKIIDEGRFLYGNKNLCEEIKKIIVECGVSEKLRKLKKIAEKNRIKAEKYLLGRETLTEDEYLRLFRTTEEFCEIF
jgi:hypothetical protein